MAVAEAERTEIGEEHLSVTKQNCVELFDVRHISVVLGAASKIDDIDCAR
jgi:hypothetical protein